MAYEEQLKMPSLFSVDNRILRGDLIAVYNFLMRGSGEGGVHLCSLVSSEGMCENGLKLCQGPSVRRWSSIATNSSGKQSCP